VSLVLPDSHSSRSLTPDTAYCLPTPFLALQEKLVREHFLAQAPELLLHSRHVRWHCALLTCTAVLSCLPLCKPQEKLVREHFLAQAPELLLHEAHEDNLVVVLDVPDLSLLEEAKVRICVCMSRGSGIGGWGLRVEGCCGA
jgi:hypothetical protein